MLRSKEGKESNRHSSSQPQPQIVRTMRHAWCYLLATATAITRTTVDVGRVSVTYDQHYFDTPVPQPRQGQRVADRSGLRPWPCAVPLLQHLCDTMPSL